MLVIIRVTETKHVGEVVAALTNLSRELRKLIRLDIQVGHGCTTLFVPNGGKLEFEPYAIVITRFGSGPEPTDVEAVEGALRGAGVITVWHLTEAKSVTSTGL